jgi:hypothetical protein
MHEVRQSAGTEAPPPVRHKKDLDFQNVRWFLRCGERQLAIFMPKRRS